MGRQQRTYVVGVDASAESDRALDWTRSTAGPNDVIVVVHAWDVVSAVMLDEYTEVPSSELDQIAERAITELTDRLDDPRIEGTTRQGHAGKQIVECADDRDADAIVVGHSGSGRASVVLGSTANHVIHNTRRPVVVVRGDRRETPELIVVGADDQDVDDDGENESVRALRWAYGVEGAQIIEVAHSWFMPSVVAGRFSNPGVDFEDYDRAAIEVAERVIAAAGEIPEGLDVRAVALNGTPEFALIEASRDADLVVVGSRGRGGFAGLVLGSTSLDLTAHAHCPVAIVR